MSIDWSALETLASGEVKDLWKILRPYLPALARSGQDVVDGFVKHLLNKEWTQIDQLMYQNMTPEERRELEDEVLADARDAAAARFDRIQLEKDIAFKLLLNLVLKLL
jgi:hypothetical protein